MSLKLATVESHPRPVTGPIVVLSYDPEAPSFRYRMQPALERLQADGYECQTMRMPKGRYGMRFMEIAEQLQIASVVVLAKIQLSAPECWLIRRYARVIAFDIDDAIYVRRPRAPGLPPGDSRWRRGKFAATCSTSDLVMAGNNVLAAAAAPHAHRVEIVPTPVDVDRYRPSHPDPNRPPTLVWVGRPENLDYLELIRPALVNLLERWPQLRLRIVCSHFPKWNDVPIERVPWSAHTEVSALASADIGLMPLSDDEWTRGKCAFKLLQYAAAALPCVASDVGANREAVIHGVSGYVVNTTQEWEQALAALLSNPAQRHAFGLRGLEHVRANFDTRVLAGRVADLLSGAALQLAQL